MFSCEYCDVFKTTYFEEHLRTTASYFMQGLWKRVGTGEN